MTQTRSGSLREALQATVDHVAEIAPPPLFKVFGDEQERLAATDDSTGRIRVGDLLTRTTLRDAAGHLVPVPGARPAVVVFYRGAWCPYCNVALAAYQHELLPELTVRGVDLVAVSPQGRDGSMSIAEANELAFPVLTDAGGEYARHLGIAFDLADDVKAAQLAFGNDFTTINIGSEWSLPMPTVLVVDRAGVVRFLDVRPDYTQRTEPADILSAVRAIA